jgi:hypothetical protein
MMAVITGAAEAMSDVAVAHAALEAKGPAYTILWQYYDGVQPLVYSTERLQSLFRTINGRFSENWCGAVVNAAVDRLNLTGFAVTDQDEATAQLGALFSATDLGLDSDDVHLAALVCGEAFVIAWPDDSGAVSAYYNDPRMVHAQYDADNPKHMSWAAKRWVTDDGTYRLTMYYSDRIEYYQTIAKADNVTDAAAYRLAETPAATNPYGEIPVFHFRRATRAIRSELTDVIPLQDAVNKLFADMMVSAEFGAFRQRYIISQADVSTLKNSPNEIWNIPAGDGTGQQTQVGEFSQTELGSYLSAMDQLAMAIAIITRTPKHYMLAQGGDPSGEALITMEAPLTRKVERYQEHFSATWKRAAAFMLRLSGTTVEPSQIVPQYDPIATVQPLTQAQVGVLKDQLGVSKPQIQRELGYTEEQIVKMQEERAAQSAALGAQLLTAFDHGDDTDGEGGLE